MFPNNPRDIHLCGSDLSHGRRKFTVFVCVAVVLGDSVLGFHKHGMQGLGLSTAEVSWML